MDDWEGTEPLIATEGVSSLFHIVNHLLTAHFVY